MKKLSKKALAFLLAALMLLSLAPAAAATPQNPLQEPVYRADGVLAPQAVSDPGTVAVKTPGTAEATLYYDRWDDWYYVQSYDLSGLVFEASGSGLAAPVTVAYDSLGDWIIKDGQINWQINVYLDWQAQNGWKLGPNQAILRVRAYQYTNFQVVEVVNGVEYGTFDLELIFRGQTTITVQGVEYDYTGNLDTASAVPLTLNVPAPVSISEPPEDESPERALFKFTPDADGYYCFKSAGGKSGQELYTIDGDYKWFPGIYPYANLYDETGRHLAYGSRDYYGATNHYCNFVLYYQLEKGKTYYLETYTWNASEYTVTVELTVKKLAAPKSLSMNYHQLLDMYDLLEGTTWHPEQLSYYCDGEVVQRYYDDWYNFYAANTGKGTITIVAPDGASVTVEVTVRYSLDQWFCIIFLGGWLWMKYTPITWSSYSLVDYLWWLSNYGLNNLIGTVIGGGLDDFLSGIYYAAARFFAFFGIYF